LRGPGQEPDRWGHRESPGSGTRPPTRYGVAAEIAGIVLALVAIAIPNGQDDTGSTIAAVNRIGLLVGVALAVLGTLVILANGPRPRW
jgi:hypothetical protein